VEAGTDKCDLGGNQGLPLWRRWGEEEEVENLASDTNNTAQAEIKRRLESWLAQTAKRYENDALELLNKARPDSEAAAKVQEALSLIANATASIEAQDFDSARNTPREAYKAMLEAQHLIEDKDDEDGNTSTTSNSGGNSDNDGSEEEKESSDDDDEEEDSGNGNSGKEKDKDKEDSNKGGNDDDNEEEEDDQ
jgi:hypothetical protein